MKPSTEPISTEHADFASEINAHLDSLYGLALRLTRTKSDAEDLVQDAVLRAFRFYDHFEPGTNFKAWLFRILTNTFINRYRRTTREHQFIDRNDPEVVNSGTVSQTALWRSQDPENLADRNLLSQEIETALGTLSEMSRIIVLLADVEELSYREIADVLGCPIGTVMSRLHRARRSIQQHLLPQAIAMGIVKPNADETPKKDSSSADKTTVASLDDYKRRKEARSS